MAYWTRETTEAGKLYRSLFTAAVLTTGLVGCASSDLKPAPAADEVAGVDEAAVDTVNNVRVVVESSAWEGEGEVARQLTPLEVRVENDSEMPLYIRYQQFSLVGPEGQHYSALPPIAARQDIEQNVAAAPMATPTFGYDNFFVSPAYSYAYTGMPVWRDDLGFDPFYYDTYYPVYQDLGVSTPELRSRALPEGVVGAGGEVEGFIYFEHVGADMPRVEFRGELVNADTGRAVGTVTIPFVVGEN